FDPLARCFSSTNRLHMLHCGGESEPRHVAVYTFELIRIYGIGLMPDAHASIRADSLIEFFPCHQMRVRGVTGKLLKVFKGTPVLYENGSVEIPEEFCVQKSL